MKTPRPYQTIAIDQCRNRNTLIADEPGLGKTYQALAGAASFCGTLEGRLAVLPILVVCRKRKCEDWADEAFDTVPHIPAIIFERPPANKLDMLVFVITHYESVSINIKEWSRLGLWSCIILDEAHSINNRDAKRTKAIKSLKCMRKIAVTGTPIDKSATELWSVINWLYPHEFRSYQAWYDRHSNYEIVYTKDGPREKIAPGVRDFRALAADLAPFTLHRTKRQVTPELPPKIIKKQMITLMPDQQSFYNVVNACRDIELAIEPEKWLWLPNELTKITRLQQITSNPSMLNLFDAPSTKLLWLFDYYNDNDIPIVIFTKFTETALLIADFLCIPAICGNRKDRIETFTGGNSRGIVGTIDAMGEGFNLQRGEVSIFVDLHWSSIKMGQAIERTHRMNAHDPKKIIYLVARGTVDELIFDAFNEKWSDKRLIQAYIERQKAPRHSVSGKVQ